MRPLQIRRRIWNSRTVQRRNSTRQKILASIPLLLAGIVYLSCWLLNWQSCLSTVSLVKSSIFYSFNWKIALIVSRFDLFVNTDLTAFLVLIAILIHLKTEFECSISQRNRCFIRWANSFHKQKMNVANDWLILPNQFHSTWRW